MEKIINDVIKELSGQTDEYEKKYKETYIKIIKELGIDKIFNKSAEKVDSNDMQKLIMKSYEKFDEFDKELQSRTKKYKKEVPKEEMNLLEKCKSECGEDLTMIHHYTHLFFGNDYSNFCKKIKQAVKDYHPLMNLDDLKEYSKKVVAESKRLIEKNDKLILKLSNDIKLLSKLKN